MAKEILLYGDINSDSSILFITGLNDAIADDISVRVNTPGGNPEYGWGSVAKFAEHPGKKGCKVDGKAHSFGLYFLCYTDDVEALDVSTFLIHRAAYPSWLEQSDYFTDALKGNLATINANLKKALENKIDVPALEAIMESKPETKGKTFKDIFSMDGQLDVFLNASEAKKIRLIKKINKITPAKKSEIESLMFEVSALHNGFEISAKKDPEINLNKNKMITIETLKAEHPGVYAQIIALGVEQGVRQEKDRVEACLVFNEIDPVGVKAAIEAGVPLSQKQMSEFALKTMSASALKKIGEESPKEVKTTEVKTKSEAELKKEAYEAEVMSYLK
jgi:ATP-dependent protease ClpP protease subunit